MSLLRRLVDNDLGGETADYALVLGFVVLGSATAVGAASGSVTGWWGVISTSITTIFGSG